MKEPKRDSDVKHMVPYVADRVELIFYRLRLRGFDPVLFEGRRSLIRQMWLYGSGRTVTALVRAHISLALAKLLVRPGARQVTWTLDSLHIKGKAADVISKSRLWNWPEFFVALKEETAVVGMKTIPQEGCHIQWS